MTYEFCKQQVLFQYHKNLEFWHIAIGKMYEATNGFTTSGEYAFQIGKNTIALSFNSNTSEWNICEQPVEPGIKYVRKMHSEANPDKPWFLIKYNSGRHRICLKPSQLPETARLFIDNSTYQLRTERHDEHGDLIITIYSME